MLCSRLSGPGSHLSKRPSTSQINNLGCIPKSRKSCQALLVHSWVFWITAAVRPGGWWLWKVILGGHPGGVLAQDEGLSWWLEFWDRGSEAFHGSPAQFLLFFPLSPSLTAPVGFQNFIQSHWTLSLLDPSAVLESWFIISSFLEQALVQYLLTTFKK